MKTFLRKPFLIAIAFVIVSLLSIQQSFSQTVVTNPTSPWTVPAGVTSIKVEVWGGGGGGGGCAGVAGFLTGAGGGGGGGAYNVATFTVIPGHTFNITIGGGGTVGSNAAGGNGGTTTVNGADGTVSATGGGGGGRGNFTTGTAGAASTGGFNNGGAGAAASGSGSGGGGGGAGNLTPANAGKGTSATNNNGGAGGPGNPNTAPYTGGAGASGSNGTNNGGTAGTAPGGGGSGAISNTASQSGGVGGAGQVVITYTACIPPAAPTVTTPVNLCLNSSASPLTATGSNLLWYTAPTGGTGSSTAPTPSTIAVGSVSYYVSQTIGCEGPRAAIVVNTNDLPVAAVTNQSNITCFAANDGTITVAASGGTTPGNTPYQFTVNGGAPTPTWLPATGTNLRLFTGLLPNTAYRIRVMDNHGCISK